MWQRIKSFFLKNNSLRQTVFKNTFWLTAGTTGSRIARAVLVIYAARILGTEGYGIFSYALSLAALFTIFSDIGLTGLLTREVVKKPEKISAYIATTSVIKFFAVVITVFVTIILAPNFTSIAAVKPLIPITALLLVFDSLRGFSFSITRAQNRMELEGIFTVMNDVFITTLGLLVLFLKPTTYLLTLAYTAGSGLGFLVVAVKIFGQFKGLLKHFDKSLIKPILGAAWPFAIVGLLGAFMINIDTIFIGYFRTASELGLYGAAQRPIQLLYLLPALFGTSLFPIVSNLIHKNDPAKIRSVMEKSNVAVLAMAIPLTLGSIMLGGQLIYLFFGQEYMGATLTFQLLSLTFLLIFPNTLISNAIFAYDRQNVFVVSSTLGALANCFFDWLFIPKYGIAGSAVATIISLILFTVYNWVKMKQINNFEVWPSLTKIISASLLMSGATVIMYFLGINVLLNVAISAAVYYLLLVAFKEPLLSEIGLIFGINGRGLAASAADEISRR